MNRYWNRISTLGITESINATQIRSIVLSNQISIILTLLASILTTIVWVNFGITRTTPILLLMLAAFISVPMYNWRRAYNTSRLLLCTSIPFFALSLALVSKFGADTEVFEYFDSRIIIIVSSIIPAIIFSTEEKSKLIFCLSSCFLFLVLYDPIHNFLGIGFFQKGFTSTNYNFINFIAIISFVFLVGSVIFLKNMIHDYENEKEHLITQLNDQNQELRIQNEENIEQRRELLGAKNLIEKQKQELARQNKELAMMVDEKTQDLIDTNRELVQHNNELQQFSYTISHNLRAPVASLIGLSNIFERQSLTEENMVILEHLKKSAESLDKVFRDLNKVLEIRNNIAAVKEKINLMEEVAGIRQSLENEIKASGIRVIEDYAVESVFLIRPFFDSILYNLISNAIKYRHRRRKSFIRIIVTIEDEMVVIKVEDNGLGMDIDRHSEDIFKMYKRFHEHTEGKGLGLYLVKLQTGAMGGTISVDSRINEGTTFIIRIKYLEDIHNQTIVESDYSRIFYDALTNIAGVKWKRRPENDDFRDVHLKCLQLIRQYHIPNLMLDLRTGFNPGSDEKSWLIDQLLPEATDHGLKKVIALTKKRNQSDAIVEFIGSISVKSPKLGFKFATFHSINEAKEWVKTG